MAVNLSDCEKILLVNTSGNPYTIGSTPSSATVNLSQCEKVILINTSGEPYTAA